MQGLQLKIPLPRQFCRAILIALGTCAAAPLMAEESKQTFTLYDYENREVGVYSTEAQAVAEIPSFPIPFPFYEGLFSHVTEIKSVEDVGDGTLRITYWMGEFEPLDKEWVYSGGSVDADNELDAYTAMLQG